MTRDKHVVSYLDSQYR